MSSRLIALLLSAAPLLGACATAPTVAVGPDARPVVMERDFAGRSYAKGTFTNKLTGSRRGLTVVLDGRWDGHRLTLREDFTYSDGERDVKTWVLTRTGPGTYSGTREDVVGTADIRQQGPAVRLSYDTDVKTSSGTVRVHFEDVIERGSEGMIVNRAVVSKLGVPIGDVDLAFARRPLN